MHESPDYYRLKCSVFNDDKKTDLIGESWIDLKEVVTPGGGQNDLWHQLHFKGKYAGDIRIELTYYDTRPKDEAVLEKKREKDRNRSESNTSGSVYTVGGPRQLGPREVKRRPLPPGPGENPPIVRPSITEMHSSPVPVPQLQQGYDPRLHRNTTWGPDQHYHTLPLTTNSYQIDSKLREQYSQDQPTSQDYHHPPSHEYSVSGEDFHGPSTSGDFDHTPQLPDPGDQDPQFSHYTHQPQLGAQSTQTSHNPNERRYSAHASPNMHGSPTYLNSSSNTSPPSAPAPRTTPGSSDHLQRSHFNGNSTSPVKSDMYRDSPLRQSMSHHDVEPDYVNASEPSDEEGPPPAPPVHRTNTSDHTPQSDPYRYVQAVPIPEPLNISSPNHFSPDIRSPLQSIERNYDQSYNAARSPVSPSSNLKNSYQAYTKPTYTPIHTPPRSLIHGQPLNGIEKPPPSLRAGYGSPTIRHAEFGSSEGYEDRESVGGRELLQQSQERGSVRNGDLPYDLPSLLDEPGIYRSQPTLVQPRVVSSEPRHIAARKSVSPRPQSAEDERRLSGIPFGPDSYEVLNPVSSQASSTDIQGPRYETPEQAKEAARLREVEKLRDQGPIIGNDGRVIDPSDHLPTDTWAPEPERKTRKPEHVIRFKIKEQTRTPNKSASSPIAGPPLSLPTSLHGSSPPAILTPDARPSQSRTGRNRLQKQMPSRPLPTQPFQHSQSSPTLPTAIDPSPTYDRPSPRSGMPTRPHLSEYAMFSGPDTGAGYAGSSQTSPFSSGPPPLPAKVPFHTPPRPQSYGGYSGMDVLSAELSMIDIGVGNGGRSAGRTRRAYGP